MKLAVWNMCNKADKLSATEQIHQYFQDGYDAVALQEVPYVGTERMKPLSADIANTLGLDHTFIHTRGLSRRRLSGYGTAVLSTASLASARHTTLRTDRWSYATKGKGNQRAAIAFTHPAKPEARIVVSHLSYGLAFGIGRTGLQDERRKLAQFLSEELQKGFLLFTGDTNCKPQTELDAQLAAIGLTPVHPTNEAIDAPTYKSRYPGMGNVQVALDRVYASEPAIAQVHLGEYGPSDHRPLIIKI